MRLVSDFPVTVTVYKDGKPIERKTMSSGQRLTLDPSLYQVRLSAPNFFYEATQRVEIVADQTTGVTLPPLGLIKKVVVMNGWANFFIDGKEVGETPLFDLKVATGRHQFKLVGSNGKSREYEREITVDTPLIIEEPSL